MRVESIIVPDRHRSYSSHGSKRSHFFYFGRAASFLLLLLLTAEAGLCAQPRPRKPLTEAAVVNDADGKIIHVDVNDTWLFELMTDVNTPDFHVPAGTRFTLLPCAILERLIADVNDRAVPRYRLSARVTLYGGKKYLLPTYYLPLSKFKGDQSPPEAGRSLPTPDANSPELAVPKEVLEQLKKPRPLRGPRKADAGPDLKPLGRMLVDVVGLIEREGDRFVFVPYALGWNLGSTRYELLPCSALERVTSIQTKVLDPIRFNVAGFITEFKGKQYLLLQRAIVVYNYGNFSR